MRHYRCKIIHVDVENPKLDVKLSVLISGIKNQTVIYTPQQLVLNDALLQEFSPCDARAITFYALYQEHQNEPIKPTYQIIGQNFDDCRTIFILKSVHDASVLQKSAQELYASAELLGLFSQADLINIISTAIQEQTINDLKPS